MAQTMFMTYPLDQPRLVSPGVRYRESDWHGSAKYLSRPPESMERAAKGDLSMQSIANFEPRPLTALGLPYVLR